MLNSTVRRRRRLSLPRSSAATRICCSASFFVVVGIALLAALPLFHVIPTVSALGGARTMPTTTRVRGSVGGWDGSRSRNSHWGGGSGSDRRGRCGRNVAPFAPPSSREARSSFRAASDGHNDGQRRTMPMPRSAKALSGTLPHLAGSAMLAMVIFLSALGLVPPESSSPGLFHPDVFAARAEPTEQVAVAATSPAAATPSATENEEAATINEPDAKSTKNVVTRPGVLDEVWRLVDKYYIDRTLNGLDWNDVRSTYQAREDQPPKDGTKTMALATEMVTLLNDKYSRILDKPSYERIQKFDLIGVGATLMPNAEKRIVVGAPPVPGSAADKAGLQVGDYIAAVNGVATSGRTAFDIIDQIAEDPNTGEITFTVMREGDDDLPTEGTVRDVTLARSFVEVKDPVEHSLQIRKQKLTGGGSPADRVGYVRVREFNALIEPKLTEALVDLERRGANAYVLDLRSNPGGAFQSAVEVAGLFLPKNRIATYVVDNNGVELPFRTARDRVVVDEGDPVVVWIDKGTASASEVLTGALHDNCRAVVMGERESFGKGLIQAVYGLRNGYGLVLTVAKYVTPNGNEIQGNGVKPDIVQTLPFFPGFTSDTSGVDFEEAGRVLRTKVCPST